MRAQKRGIFSIPRFCCVCVWPFRFADQCCACSGSPKKRQAHHSRSVSRFHLRHMTNPSVQIAAANKSNKIAAASLTAPPNAFYR